MGMTIVQKILARATGRGEVAVGDVVEPAVDLAMSHENGALVIVDTGYKIYDTRNKEVSSGQGAGGDADHVGNFLDCIRTGKRPNADIEDAHKSTLLCHLGNISYRVNRVLTTSAENGHIQNDQEAAALWDREYRPDWTPKV